MKITAKSSKSSSRSGMWVLMYWNCWKTSWLVLCIPLNNTTFCTNEEINERFLKTGQVDHPLVKIVGKCGKDSWYFELNLEDIVWVNCADSFPLLAAITLAFYWSHLKVPLLRCKDVTCCHKVEPLKNKKLGKCWEYCSGITHRRGAKRRDVTSRLINLSVGSMGSTLLTFSWVSTLAAYHIF